MYWQDTIGSKFDAWFGSLRISIARNCWAALAATLVLSGTSTEAATLKVGPGLEFPSPSDAAHHTKDGDVVAITAGDYRGDVAVWRASNLTIRAVGGKVRLFADGNSSQGKAIWVVQGSNTIIEGVEFHDARVLDHNGAGIRAEGDALTVRNCKFFDNENGILTGNKATATLVIEASEFGRNGYGDGYSHNLYVGRIASLTVRGSYFHEALVGHQLKSRARMTRIERSRFSDLANGRSSYALDFPDGGEATIIDSVIEKGPFAENSTLISFGAESLHWPTNRLTITGSKLVNPQARGRFIFVRSGAEPVVLENNLYEGPAARP